MKSVLLIASLLFGAAAHAESFAWIPRLSCGNGGFVIDGRHSFDSGFTAYQAVIRGGDAIDNLRTHVAGPITLSPKVEIILSNLTLQPNYVIETQWMTVKLSGPGELVYLLHGHLLEGNRYILSLTEFSCTPGACGPPPGAELTNYIFNNCQVLN